MGHPNPYKEKDYISRAVNTGLNQDKDTLRDDRYVRCKQCGYLCHLDRDIKGHKYSQLGDGNDYDDSTYGDDDRADPTTDSGCPFCGSYLYR